MFFALGLEIIRRMEVHLRCLDGSAASSETSLAWTLRLPPLHSRDVVDSRPGRELDGLALLAHTGRVRRVGDDVVANVDAVARSKGDAERLA